MPALTYSGAFDGRYVYLTGENLLVRYDTQADFSSKTSWNVIDLNALLGPGAGGAGAFDGRYLYLSGAPPTRLDTTVSPNLGSSWQPFDTTRLSPAVPGYGSLAFDGQYLYIPPSGNAANTATNTARYDTRSDAGFTSSSAWASFDMSTMNGGSIFTTNAVGNGFGVACGATSDGRYVYYAAPWQAAIATRFDNQGGFTTPSSWSQFSLYNAYNGPDFVVAEGGCGAIFDGRYVYYPQRNAGSFFQYDTTQPFTTGSSWQFFFANNVSSNVPGYNNGTFDGRYVYFAPVWWDSSTRYFGLAMRYDTSGPFTLSSSWSTFDIYQLNQNAVSYGGATFDGHYVYFTPNAQYGNTFVARFDARSPTCLPSVNRGGLN